MHNQNDADLYHAENIQVVTSTTVFLLFDTLLGAFVCVVETLVESRKIKCVAVLYFF